MRCVRQIPVFGPTIVCLGLVCAVFVAAWQAPARKATARDLEQPTKAQVIEHIEGLKGEVRIDGEHPDEPVWMVDLSPGELDGEVLELLKLLPKLEVLNLNDLPITDDHLLIVGRLKSLRELSLNGTQITDAGLKSLGALTGLESLSVCRTRLTNAGLKHLAPLRRLKDLNFFDTAVTNQAVTEQFAGRVKVFASEPSGIVPGDPSKLPRPEPLVEVEEEHLMGDRPEELAEYCHARGVAVFLTSRGNPLNLDRAYDLLEVAVANDPSNVDYKIDLADACALSGNPFAVALACELYEEVLTDLPDDETILARLVDAYISLNNYGAARDVVTRRTSDSLTTPFQMALIAIASNDYDSADNAQRALHQPLASSYAAVLSQLKSASRDETANLPDNSRRQPEKTPYDPWMRLVATQQHVEKITAGVVATFRDSSDDGRPPGDTIRELIRCLALVDLTEQQVRHDAPKLSLGIDSQMLNDEISLLRSEAPDSLEGGFSRVQSWQSIATLCFWRAIQDAIQDLDSCDSLQAAQCVSDVMDRMLADHSSEQQLLADQIGALAHRVETAHSTPAEAGAQSALRDFQGYVQRRERQLHELRVVLAFLLRSVSTTHRSESYIGGSQMLVMFKMEPLTGFIRPGGPVWQDRVVALDLWLRSEDLAASLHKSISPAAKRPSTRYSPRTHALLALAEVLVADQRRQPVDATVSAEWLSDIRSEVKLQLAMGASDATVCEWVVGKLRESARRLIDQDGNTTRILSGPGS
ncbi:MAG: hypothetical protein JSS49_03970 [Planctomycetes bacterium]|nr:hypothetical protein [Planctomycetota bacterium]